MMKILCLLGLLVSTASAAEFSDFRPQASNITFVSKQMGVPVEGGFKKFAAKIVFDPAKIEQANANVEIDMASIDTGSADANHEVATVGWFNSKNFPQESFVSSALKKIDETHLQALGKLTIKGKSKEISAPFAFKQQGDSMILEGFFPIKRGDFGIGSGIWADPDVVAEEVQIRFRLIVGATPSSTLTKKGK